MKNTFAYFKNINNYTTLYNSRNNANSPIDDQTICFIEEGGEIYTHGKAFGGSSNSESRPTIPTPDEITLVQEGNTYVIDPSNLPKAGINKLGILGLKGGGGVKIDANTMIYIDPAETLQTIKNYITQNPSTEVPLTPASKSKLGGVIVGNGIDVSANGTISANVQLIKNMFTEAGITLGGVSSLNELIDGTPSQDQVIKWNGSKWVPAEDLHGEGGEPANYVVGWNENNQNITFYNNTNDSVTISKSGENNEFDIDDVPFTLSLNGYDLSLNVNGVGKTTVTLPSTEEISLSPASDDNLGGIKAYSHNSSDNNNGSYGASLMDDLLYDYETIRNYGYKQNDDITVFPLRIDTANNFGYIEIKNSLFGSGDGSYTLPTASSTVLGGVKVGSGLAIDSSTGILSCTVNPGEGGLSNAFSRVSVGDTNIDASGSDAFSLVAGTNITLNASAANKTITINATGGGDGETTYIENPYDDTAVLNRITAAENSLRNIHNWTESEINALAKTQVDTYKTHKSDIGTWIETGEFDDELSARFVTLGYTQDENVAWSTLSLSVDQITASVNSLTLRQDGDDTRYTALNSSLNTQITKINDLETSVATLGTSYATLNEDADALSWLASYYRSETRNDRTLAQVFSDVQTSAELATAAVQTQINTLDGRVTSAETSLASMVTDVNNLKSNSAGYLTSATLDGAVATMFASTTNGTGTSGKGKVAAFIEARVGDMVSDAAQGTGALSELVLGADQITLEGDTTVAGKLSALEARFGTVISDVNGTKYLWVGDNGQNSLMFTVMNSRGIGFTNEYSTNQFNSTTDNWDRAKIYYDELSLRPTLNEDVANSTSGITLQTKDNGGTYTIRLIIAKHGEGRTLILPTLIDINEDASSSIDYATPTTGNGKYAKVKPGELTLNSSANDYIILKASDTSTFSGSVIATSITQGSDIRYKNVIDDIHIDVADIAAAPKFTYTNKNGNNAVYAGTSAQYWRDIIPETVFESEDGKLSFAYGNAALISAISVAEEVVALKNEIAELKQQIAALTSNN